MITLIRSGCIAIAMCAAVIINGAEPKADSKPVAKTSATFMITGLHCQPCTTTVEKALKKTPGVAEAKVDWKTKNATIQFDESKLPVQQLTEAIANTPHMMGDKMHYEARLALKVPDIKDEASAKPVIEALKKVSGIKSVAVNPEQKSIGIQFDKSGKLTTKEIVAALDKAGIKASNY